MERNILIGIVAAVIVLAAAFMVFNSQAPSDQAAQEQQAAPGPAGQQPEPPDAAFAAVDESMEQAVADIDVTDIEQALAQP
ncbi:MAG: hypothetical protein HY519_00105 [Candidatus Aenigmarchaeota archaeon]|nr:hypothetical protein [Candidatus Aenigmarchaeota archaeon]